MWIWSRHELFWALHRFNRYMVECEFPSAMSFHDWHCSFNRYMVECELKKLHLSFLQNISFNRYMVECECILMKKSSQIMICFNRYMVECEYLSNENLNEWIGVLIDTWWNVNQWYAILSRKASAVLIDTWWNVNLNCHVSSDPQYHGFNRYMVECEYLSKLSIFQI